MRSYWFAALYTLTGLVAGLLGSIYDEQIANSIPLDCCRYEGPQWGAAAFWLSATSTAVMFLLQHRAAEKDRRDAQTRLETRSAELAYLIRTQPPREFLDVFADLYERADHARRVALDGGDPDELELVIRLALEAVALLARDFDRETHPTSELRYAANLMEFRPQATISAMVMPTLRPRLRFMDEGLSIYSLRGVLVLRRALSAVAEANEPEGRPDPLVEEIALPIPPKASERAPAVLPAETALRWRVLPGAPMAFTQGAFEVYSDGGEVVEWCNSRGDFPHPIITQIQQYFGRPAEHGVVSFASFPLYLSGAADRPIGVLNVHRNSSGLLRERRAAAQFAALLDPFRALIADLLITLQARRLQ